MIEFNGKTETFYLLSILFALIFGLKRGIELYNIGRKKGWIELYIGTICKQRFRLVWQFERAAEGVDGDAKAVAPGFGDVFGPEHLDQGFPPMWLPAIVRQVRQQHTGLLSAKARDTVCAMFGAQSAKKFDPPRRIHETGLRSDLQGLAKEGLAFSPQNSCRSIVGGMNRGMAFGSKGFLSFFKK
jgi:hypothetical protein